MNLTDEQAAAMQAISAFVQGGSSIFILKGYAGTGKTTLLKSLIDILPRLAQGRPCFVFAPTGRAAKILKDKTGLGSTIHTGIYVKASETVNYSENENLELVVDTKNQDNKIVFEIDTRFCRSRPIVVVDEASMISSKTTHEDRLQFGTDNLLDDLLTFSGVTNGGQIIFVGDDAQLPPVGDNISSALSPEFFAERHLPVQSATLTTVLRQGAGSVILENAKLVRDNIFKEKRDRFGSKYRRQENEFTDISAGEAIITAARQIDDTILISFTNAAAAEYNTAIRRVRFPGHSEPVPGDRLIVVRNSYNLGADDITGGFSMFNGEFCSLLEVGEEEVKFPFVGNKMIELRFRNVKIRHESGTILSLKIVVNLLDSPHADLTEDECKALFSEFTNRHRHLTRKEHREEFLKALHDDPYFNALQVKYGYAITCHKAQGGEWNNVIVDLNGRTGLNTESLRWTYTALTRAARRLMLVNSRTASPITKMNIRDISQARSMDAECHADEDADIPTSTPFHSESAASCKRLKFSEVKKVLKPNESIVAVTSKEWQECYNIGIGGNLFRYDTTHNKKGIFKPFVLVTTPATAEATDLLLRLNTTKPPECRYSYTPASTALEYLDGVVKECAAQAGLMITNVVDHPSQFFVNYYFFSTTYHKVQFYYGSNGDVTTSIPSTIGETNDPSLVHFIRCLDESRQSASSSFSA